MRYWEKKLFNDERVKLVAINGYQKSAEILKVSEQALRETLAFLQFEYDAEVFCETQLKIIDKNGNLVPLKLNAGQRKIMLSRERQLLAGKPVRQCLLKARQFGGSTFAEAEVFRECILKPGRSAMIIAHDLDSARHLREMSSRFNDYYELPKPRIKKETDKWWKFLHRKDGKAWDSNLRIDTAEELSTGHSLTLHHLHLSEIQNWRNATALVKGLFPTVPNNPDTTIFMEGTGSGVGDYWYDFCQMSMSGETEWEFIFVAWHEIEEYQESFDSPDKREDFKAKLDSEENALFHQGISLEKLNWRRKKILGDYKGDIDAFKQQYPASPEEAFLTSGRPVFNPIKVKEGLNRSKDGKRGYLKWAKITKEKPEKNVEWIDDEKGYWEIWEIPNLEITNLHALGADVAEGIAVVPELGIRGGDFSVAKILRRDNRKMVARLRERLDPDIFADELEKAWYYWKCGILVENNPGGSGNVVIRDLKEKPINLLKTVTLDRIHDTKKEQYGWDTNKDSKREMIDELTEHIREESFTDPSKNFWYECSTYARDEKGRTNAQSRKYDDEVIATALTFQADKLMPMVFKNIKETPQTYTRDMDVPRAKKFGYSQKEVMEANYIA